MVGWTSGAQCIESCDGIEGVFLDEENSLCTDCDSTCKTCKNKDNCETCPEEKYMYLNPTTNFKECRPNCP